MSALLGFAATISLTASLTAPLSSGLSGGSTACPEATDEDSHTMDVCADYLEGASAYSVTFSASLSPRPAHQQVAVFRYEGEWWIRMAGYRWEPGTALVEHRRNEMPISDAEASQIIALMSREKLGELARDGYYGAGDQICLDGASLNLAAAENGQLHTAGRHSCASSSEINEIAQAFRALALKYDAGFDGMLTGLSN